MVPAVMSERWEYASVTWVEEVRKIQKTDPEYQRLSFQVKGEWDAKDWAFYWWKTQTMYIWLPGAEEADVRLAWETTDDDYRVSRLQVFNELGAAGWEVASSEVLDNAMGPSYGRETTSYPICIYTLFKRRVEG
jgi:hypothetical protein